VPDATEAVAGLLATGPVESSRALLESFAAPPAALAEAWLEVARRSGLAADADRAAAALDAATAGAAPDLRLAVLEAMIDDVAGRHDAAAATYRGLLEERPDDVVLLNNLAMALVHGGRDCEEAVTAAERARELAPQVAAVADTLVQALVCAGRVERAIEIADEAIAGSPESPLLLLASAEALVAGGRPAEARRALAAAGAFDHPVDRRRVAAVRAAIDGRADVADGG